MTNKTDETKERAVDFVHIGCFSYHTKGRLV